MPRFLLLCPALLLAHVGFSQNTTAEGLVYAVTGDKVTITGYTGSALSLAIPSAIAGLPVTSIGNSAFVGSALVNVTIPASVTSIGSSAFSSCNALTAVRIPAGVTALGSWAFIYCAALTSVTIPATVTSIGRDVFYGCSSLAAIQVEAGNPAYASDGKVLFNQTRTTLLKAANSGVTGTYVIPVSVTSIDSNAFQSCTALTGVTIPAGVTTIGSNAFDYCIALSSVTIPASVTSIGSNAFYNCSSLATIQVEAGNPAYASDGKVLFNQTRTTLLKAASAGVSGAYVIPASVTSIESNAFRSCTTLTSVTIPAGVTTIGSGAFQSCSALTSATLPSGLMSIGSSAFQSCTVLTGVTIPAGVTAIGSNAFDSCTSLSSVTLPASVTSIGSNKRRRRQLYGDGGQRLWHNHLGTCRRCRDPDRLRGDARRGRLGLCCGLDRHLHEYVYLSGLALELGLARAAARRLELCLLQFGRCAA